MKFTESNSTDGSLILFLGSDGSGKSTALEQAGLLLAAAGTVHQLEQTKSPELSAFKRRNIGRVVDETFLDERESLFERSNQRFVGLIERSRSMHQYTLLDGHPVITAVSHDLMRHIIGVEINQGRHVDPSSVITTLGEACVPSLVVFLHVGEDERKKRIVRRDMPEEILWGFNSPFFLMHYQRILGDAASAIGNLTSLGILDFDTERVCVEEISTTIAGHVLAQDPGVV